MNGEPTLLVVDDEASNLESLERIFAREGLTVLAAKDGKDALEVVRKQRVDVVLTDLMMPGISGVDLLKAVKQLSPETEVGADDRLRHRRDRGRGDARGRVRLRHQAAQARARRARRAQGAREAVADRREPHAARRSSRRRGGGRSSGSRWRCGARSTWCSRRRRRRRRCCCSARRAPARSCWRGRSTSRRRAPGAPFVAGQLRGDPRGDPRGRAVRLREGRVHRRGRARATAASRRPTAARCSSTRSARFR